MGAEKKMPSVGDILVHKFRKKKGEIRAEVMYVDRTNARVAVRIGDVEYPSLSTAAEAVSGLKTNGWVYWGLKKQKAKPRRPEGGK